MKPSSFIQKIFTAPVFGFVVCTAFAQKLDALPQMQVGDKWTYRHHNISEKTDPFIVTHEVKRADDESAWLYGESADPKTQWPKFWYRYDQKKADFMERFTFDAAAPNGLGERTGDRQKGDDGFRFPLEVGKKWTAKEYWTLNADAGYADWNVEVEAFEKVKTEAGEFDAYRIKFSGWWTRTTAGGGRGRTERIVWLSPQVKREVSREQTDRAGPMVWNQSKQELIKWEPAPLVAPAAVVRQ